jgi:hypothetical protein
MKMLLAALLLTGTASAAFAQTAANTMAPPGTMAPKGLDEAHARYAAEAAGYSNVSNLTSDKKGDWMGAGTKGNFMIDTSGKVTPQN